MSINVCLSVGRRLVCQNFSKEKGLPTLLGALVKTLIYNGRRKKKVVVGARPQLSVKKLPLFV